MTIRRTESRHCVFCGTSTSHDICPDCDSELPRIEYSCRQCGIPLEHDSLCGDCLIAPPAFLRCIAPLCYEPPISHLIGAFKYQGNFNYGRILSQLLIKRLQQDNIEIDTMIPVPLHWRRRWQRGFNQAEIIADEISRTLQLPLKTRWLRRTRASASQQSLDADARHKNLRDAFACSAAVRDQRIAVIDDVVTTGATANAIARALLNAGAATVEIWCLARTP